MGLDMYARAFDPETIEINEDSKLPEPADWAYGDEFHYWRKHRDLHGWMEQLYRDKGGTEVFNCVCVELTAHDLERLESDLNADVKQRLPETKGFFFGNNPPDAYSKADDLEFVREAREAIGNGKRVFYSSWW